jgi:hypothetical protein
VQTPDGLGLRVITGQIPNVQSARNNPFGAGLIGRL